MREGGMRTTQDLALRCVLGTKFVEKRGAITGLGLSKEWGRGVLWRRAESILGHPGVKETRKKPPKDIGVIKAEGEKDLKALP
ncbi:hypothetical protein L1049_024129 [Liquidambar formosana]|uniref:Uncharacterized protein n=1 Tax=Liquidambar formosana TaxID=63359 RepID=A0AAP0WZB2_LIQFO